MKNINKKVAIYDPYLDTNGGGEKHLLSIAQIFDELGYEINLLWDDTNIKDELLKRFNLTFQNLQIIPNFLKSKLVKKTLKTSEYDYLIYISDGSYFASLAKHNYIFSMVPDKIYLQIILLIQ